MRVITAFAALLLAGSASGVESFVLGNGLRVVVDHQPAQPRLALELWFAAGSGYEMPEQAGIAHLFEHAFPRSALLTNPENARAYRETSLDGNAQTKNDYSRYYIEVTSNALDLGLAILAGRMAAPPESISETDLERHKNIVAAEIRNARGRDWDPALVQPLRERLWGIQHPYGHSTYGRESSVSAITIETLRRWFSDHHAPRNAVLIVAGDADASFARESAERWFGSIPGGAAPRRPSAVEQPRELVRLNVASRPEVAFYWRGPEYGHPDAEYLDLFLRVVAARLSGESGVSLYQLGGEYSLRGNTTVKQLQPILENPAAESELAAAKAEFDREMLQSLDRLGWQGSRIELIGEGVLFRGDAEFYKQRLQRAMSAKIVDLQSAAERWLSLPPVIVEQYSQDRASAELDRSATVVIAPPPSPRLPHVERRSIGGIETLIAIRPQSQISEVTVVSESHPPIETLRENLRAVGGAARVRTTGTRSHVVVTVAARHLRKTLPIITTWFDRENVSETAARRARIFFGPEFHDSFRGMVIVSGAVLPSLRPSSAVTTPTLERVFTGRFLVDDPTSRDARLVIVMPFRSAFTASAAQGVIRQRLQRLLREEKGWTYDVSSEMVAIGGWYLTVFECVLPIPATGEALRAAESLIATLAQDTIDVARIQVSLRRDLMNGIASTSSLSRYLVDLLTMNADDPLAKRRSEIDDLSADALRSAIGEAARRTVWIVEGDEKALEPHVRDLSLKRVP